MRNHKLDQVCAKRLKANDFAQPKKYTPLLTRNETVVFVVAFLIALIFIGFKTYTTYFA